MILSKNNLTFKKLKKIIKYSKYRKLYQEFIVFGKHSIQEASKKKIVKKIYNIYDEKKDSFIKISLMKELHPHKVLYPEIALCKMIQKKIISNKILILEDVQDPGNIGNILRSACAFGFNHVFFSNKSVDLYHEKIIRTSQGAFFHLFLEKGDIIKFLSSMQNQKYSIFSTCVNQKNIDLNQCNKIFLNKYPKRILILGNEGLGISWKIKKMSDFLLNIKTSLNIESLNVSSAGSILMYILK
ncbi:spoU rRNA Methylase family protein [Candidatus Phytoplasma oryzae]|uniref:SpoU rRNA Methylase family protein n=1 Tax=Candidatus Phytoplasma oryzae TaxID=203274 RepID=A0A139JQW7_9MOLU|nr:RNA methyltransferase [Candidatus Phytoplasma oryzae]KXT29266.1 spoU rRNA Methylase family protein [Candidatus Phytoplasma oryzae]RAM57850.1 rRNA methyltransferase [Candidatus Phytoplasma oryzae]